jgi:hypothetical protein
VINENVPAVSASSCVSNMVLYAKEAAGEESFAREADMVCFLEFDEEGGGVETILVVGVVCRRRSSLDD